MQQSIFNRITSKISDNEIEIPDEILSKLQDTEDLESYLDNLSQKRKQKFKESLNKFSDLGASD